MDNDISSEGLIQSSGNDTKSNNQFDIKYHTYPWKSHKMLYKIHGGDSIVKAKKRKEEKNGSGSENVQQLVFLLLNHHHDDDDDEERR